MVFNWMFHLLLMLPLRGRILSSFTVNAWQMLHQKLFLRSSVNLLFQSCFFSPLISFGSNDKSSACSPGSKGLHLRKGRLWVIRIVVVYWLNVWIILSFKWLHVYMTSVGEGEQCIPCSAAQRWCLKAEVYLFSVLRHTGEPNLQSWACIPAAAVRIPLPKFIRWHFL